MKKVMPLGKKLIISYLCVGIVPAMLVAGICYMIASNTQKRIIRQSLESHRGAVSQTMEQTNAAINIIGKASAASERAKRGIKERDVEGLREYAKSILTDGGDLNMMGFADTTGRVLVWGQDRDTPMDVSKRNLFRNAMRGEDSVNFSSSDLSPSAILGYFPVTDESGTIIGVVVLGTDLTTHQLVDSIKRRFGIECTLFAGDMRVSTTIMDNGRRAVGTKMTNPVVVETVLRARQAFQDHNVILGNGYDTIYWPMVNTIGDIIGMFFVGMPDTIVAAASKAMLMTVLLCVAGVLVVTVVVAALVARGVVGPIVNAIETLSGTAMLLTDSAADIAETSGELVQAANDQAASMESSVSSLNELTGQARHNAEVAKSARGVMDGTMDAARHSDETMRNMLETMHKIKDSSDQVTGIVKTIEEISFQTNLLALNASVEAARAGEHGKGFAVVADEVRNLAQRAGEAAKNTSELIGASVELSNRGAEEVTRAAESIRDTLDNTDRVGKMITDVEESSEEQSHNIEQINASVASMDRATQRIATSSNEVAATSRVLEEKSGDMDVVVDQLTAIVGAKRLEKVKRRMERKGMLQLPHSGR